MQDRTDPSSLQIHPGRTQRSDLGQHRALAFILEALISATPLRVIDSRGRHLLAPKENEVANLAAEGLTNREVAKQLEVSEHTMSNYLFRIYGDIKQG